MAENDTLLAYLVSNFRGNTENIATEALRHILDRSDGAREALNDVIRSGARGVKPIGRVRTQVTGRDGGIPDLVCYDEGDAERVLIEVKFWAELTERQPNAYLARLPEDGPAVLLFLVPGQRIRSLWPELRNRVQRDFGNVEDIDAERKCIRVAETERYLMLVSWGGLLDSMAARATDYGESGVDTEIRQLRSLAKYADNGEFTPLRDGEKFGSEAESARRQRDLERLIDDATERGVAEGWASKKGLNRTPRSYGYGRYLTICGKGVWFGVNRDRWERDGLTPLWLNVTGNPSETTMSAVRDELGLQVDGKWIPVHLEKEVEYAQLLDDVSEKLNQIGEHIGR